MSYNRYTPTYDYYGDDVLFGSRSKICERISIDRAGNDTECVMFGIGTFVDKRQQWQLRDLIGYDKRLKSMLTTLDINFALPMQRYCWPKISHGTFPMLCVSPKDTGKTYAHLLFSVVQSIKKLSPAKIEEILNGYSEIYRPEHTFDSRDPDDDRHYPKCLVLTSTTKEAEELKGIIERMKEAAYDQNLPDKRRFDQLPPKVRCIRPEDQDDRLFHKCNQACILIGTPAVMLRCLSDRNIKFSRAERVIFDDLDVCLQLHNESIQKLAGIYLDQVVTSSNDNIRPAILMFARKWTELVKKFINVIFPQRILIFGSMVEAGIYANLKFELETYNNNHDRVINLIKLINYIKTNSNASDCIDRKFCIVCSTEDEAYELKNEMTKKIDEATIIVIDREKLAHQTGLSKGSKQAIVIITDDAIEYEVEFCPRGTQMSNMSHIIHYSIPDDILELDQRFRLMHRNISDSKSGLLSTVFVGSNLPTAQAKQLYDLMSRSEKTLRATRMELRHYMVDRMSTVCWRWATLNVCRFEKLSRDDRLGSYCPDRHILHHDDKTTKRWPSGGQVKITLTHILNPNEFYFWFEAHRDIRNARWSEFKSSGQEFVKKMQIDLNKHKGTSNKSVPIENIKKGRIYGVYFNQEARVDRVLLLDEPKHMVDTTTRSAAAAPSCGLARINKVLEYEKQIPVIKIDYGSRVNVYVKNLFELPLELKRIEPQCHRGFHIGYRPTFNEPDWHYKAEREFYELVTAQNVRETTVWLRFNSDNCFWFDNMAVLRQLSNIDSKDILLRQPHRELCQNNLAEPMKNEPSYLPVSLRLLTLGKWNSDELARCAQYAFLRKDKQILDVYLLYVRGDFELVLRQCEYNKRLIELEDTLMEEFNGGKLPKQQHLSEGAYCLARIVEYCNSETGVDSYTINRVRIGNVFGKRSQGDSCDLDSLDHGISDIRLSTDQMVEVECLDHGDRSTVSVEDLFEAKPNHLRTLPFQAIRGKLACINTNFLHDNELRLRTLNLMMDIGRGEDDHYKCLKCRLDPKDGLYLYATDGNDRAVYRPISKLLHDKGIQLHEMIEKDYEEDIHHHADEERDLENLQAPIIVYQAINSILHDMIKDELVASGAALETIMKENAVMEDD